MRRIFSQDFSPAKRLAVINHIRKRDGEACKLCLHNFQYDAEITVDHFVALSWGGADNIENWVLAHSNCNVGKEQKGIAWVWILLHNIFERSNRPPNKIGKIRKLEQDKASLINFAQKETEWFGVTWYYFSNAYWTRHGRPLAHLFGKKQLTEMIENLHLDSEKLNFYVNKEKAVSMKSLANNQNLKGVINNPRTWPKLTNVEIKKQVKEYVQANPMKYCAPELKVFVQSLDT